MSPEILYLRPSPSPFLVLPLGLQRVRRAAPRLGIVHDASPGVALGATVPGKPPLRRALRALQRGSLESQSSFPTCRHLCTGRRPGRAPCAHEGLRGWSGAERGRTLFLTASLEPPTRDLCYVTS